MILPVYLPHLLMAIAVALSIATLPQWSNQLVDSAWLGGLAVSGIYIGAALFNIPSGLIIGRIGLNQTMALGIAVFAAGAALELMSNSYWVLMAGRLVEGAGFSLWVVSRHTYIAAATGIEKHGRAGSLFGACFRVGFIVGPLVTSLLVPNVMSDSILQPLVDEPLKVPFFIKMALASFVLVLFIATGWRHKITLPQIQFSDMPSAIKQVLKDHRKNLFTIGMVVLIIQSLRTTREFLIPTVGVAIGAEVGLIGLILSASAVLDAAVAFSSGFILDRFGRKPVAVAFLSVTSIACLVLALASTSWIALSYSSALAWLITATLLLGAGNGLSSGIVVTMGADLAPRSHPEEFIGVWRILNDSGAAVGPAISGAVGGVSSLGTAAVLLAILGVVGIGIVWVLVPETLKRSPKPQADT